MNLLTREDKDVDKYHKLKSLIKKGKIMKYNLSGVDLPVIRYLDDRGKRLKKFEELEYFRIRRAEDGSHDLDPGDLRWKHIQCFLTDFQQLRYNQGKIDPILDQRFLFLESSIIEDPPFITILLPAPSATSCPHAG